MNAGGHIAVAAGLGPAGLDPSADRAEADPGLLLGAALPDLGSIGGFRLLGETADRSVAAGIALHHRTDDAFHRHPWFAERHHMLTARLAKAGIGRGPSLACSHVGIELLLDGELMKEPSLHEASATAYNGIGQRLEALADLVRPDDRTRWRLHLLRIAELHLPTDYDQPDAVAQRLHRILARRPRLALEQGHVETVAQVLADEQPAIASSAHEFLGEMRSLLSMAAD